MSITLSTAAPVRYQLVPLASVLVRPDLFQWRDESGKEGRDNEQVGRLVKEWDWDRYDPLTVVSDPDNPNAYIVIGGHHRLAAMSELVNARPAEFTNVEVRVLQGDVNDPDDRQRLVNQAILSNYGVHGTTLFADVKAAQEFRRQGLTPRQIADRMNVKRASKVEDLLAFGNLAGHVQQRVQLEPALYPMAAELGKAIDRGMTQDEASGFFNIWVNQYQDTQELPSPTVIRNILRLQAQKKAAGKQGSFVGSQDFIAAYQGMLAENDAMERELATLRRRLAACERLGETGTDVTEVSAAAQARIDQLKATLAARKAALFDESGDGDLVLPQSVATPEPEPEPAPAPAPPPTPAGETATDMFGNVVVIPPADDVDESEDDAPVFVQSGPSLFDAPEPAQEPGAHLDDPRMREEYQREYNRMMADGFNEIIKSEDDARFYAQKAVDDLRDEGYWDTDDERAEKQAATERGLEKLRQERAEIVQQQHDWAVERLRRGETVYMLSPIVGPMRISPKVWQSWEGSGTPLLKISGDGQELMVRSGKRYDHLPMNMVPSTEFERFSLKVEPEPAPVPAPAPAIGQATMGDDFATNQTLAMPMPTPADSGPAAPLIAPEPLRAAQERRDAVDRGQMELDDVPVPSVGRRDPAEPRPNESIPAVAGRAKRTASKGKVVPPKKKPTGRHDSLRTALLKRGRR